MITQRLAASLANMITTTPLLLRILFLLPKARVLGRSILPGELNSGLVTGKPEAIRSSVALVPPNALLVTYLDRDLEVLGL